MSGTAFFIKFYSDLARQELEKAFGTFRGNNFFGDSMDQPVHAARRSAGDYLIRLNIYGSTPVLPNLRLQFSEFSLKSMVSKLPN